LLSDKYIAVGKIVTTHGIQGELIFLMYDRSSHLLSEGCKVRLVGDKYDKEYSVNSINYSSTKFRLTFDGVNNPEDAARLRGLIIMFNRDGFPDLQGDEYYLVDLIGFELFDSVGDNIGKITDVLELPTNNSMVIEKNGKEILIPIMDDFVKNIDFDKKIVKVDNIEGFLI
jgi:16S rRNA processing protein RimM